MRNYEHNDRAPNTKQLEGIAKKLDVPVSTLEDYEFNSARDALEALFRLEDAFGLKPDDEGRLVIDPKAKGAKKLTMTLKAWRGALDEVGAGDISEDEYEL